MYRCFLGDQEWLSCSGLKTSWNHTTACTLISLYCFHRITHHSSFDAITVAFISGYAKCTFNYFSVFRVCVFISNRRHYKTHLLNSHRVQNKRGLFFFPRLFPFSQTAAAFTIEFKCHAFSARVVWLSTNRELCWIPFLSSCFNQCELAPQSYFMRGDFSASLYADDFGCLSLV